MNKYNLSIISLAIAAAVFFALHCSAALVGNTTQATLSLSPQTGSYNVNDTFTASIYVNTNNQNVVVVAAYLNYDKTHFEATSIDTTGSVFTVEAEKVIDSTNGIIKITRGIPTPGVNTANGLVAKINFKALSAVTPSSDNLTFNFTAGATTKSGVIKDDSLGTVILSGVYNGKYTVGGGTIVPTPIPTSAPITPAPSMQFSSIQEEIQSVQKSLLDLTALVKSDSENPEINSRLASIIKTIGDLQVKILGINPSAILTHTFTETLSLGSRGNEAEELQKLLAKDKDVYPEGLITGYYGLLTQQAVQRFQCKYNIVCSGASSITGYGLVGPKTRTKLNEMK